MDGADYSLLFKRLSNTRGEGNGTPLQYSCLEKNIGNNYSMKIPEPNTRKLAFETFIYHLLPVLIYTSTFLPLLDKHLRLFYGKGISYVLGEKIRYGYCF